MLGDRGHRLRPQDIGLLASVGMAEMEVFARPRVILLSTGNELVVPGRPLRPGQIYDSNQFFLTALVRRAGGELVDVRQLPDDRGETRLALQQSAARADLILSSGGVSVGEEDHLRQSLEEVGSLNLWRVNMKPGKPLAAGRIENCHYLGLPGNPVSSFVTCLLFALPLLRTLGGEAVPGPHSTRARAGFDREAVSREEYLRVLLVDGVAQLYPNQSSGVLSSLGWASGLLRQPVGKPVCSGDELDYFPLDIYR
jgi:molybdopterin molybdotransferase